MSVTLPGDGSLVATATVNGAEQQIVQVSNLLAIQPVSFTNVALTDAQLRAAAVPVSFTTAALTDTQLRAAAVPVSFTNAALTDTQLRAAAVPVSFTNAALTDAQLRAAAVPVTFTNAALTDTQLRAAAVPVAGTFFQTTQPVSAATLPLPLDAATQTTLSALNAKHSALGQALMATSMPVTIASNQTSIPVIDAVLSVTGAATQTAVINNIIDTASSANGTDLTNYRSAAIQVNSTGTAGTYIFEQCNDNLNWRPLPVFNAELIGGAAITTAITATATSVIYTFPIRGRFVRLRIVTAITGGTIQAFSRISTEPWTAAAQLVANSVAANLQTTVAGSVAISGTPTVIISGTPAVTVSGTPSVTSTQLTIAGVSVEASSAKVASGSSAAAITNASGSGVILFINVTAVTGTTPTLAVRLQVQDPVSLAWADIPGATTATITAVTSVAPILLAIDSSFIEIVNVKVNFTLPRIYRVAWLIGGTTPSFTFSVGAQYTI